MFTRQVRSPRELAHLLSFSALCLADPALRAHAEARHRLLTDAVTTVLHRARRPRPAATARALVALLDGVPLARAIDSRGSLEHALLESLDIVLARRRVDEVDRFLAPDFIDHAAPPGTPPGPGGFADGVRRILAAFPDACNHIDEMVAEGDRVVVRWTMTGTHSGDALGFSATGRARSGSRGSPSPASSRAGSQSTGVFATTSRCSGNSG